MKYGIQWKLISKEIEGSIIQLYLLDYYSSHKDAILSEEFKLNQSFVVNDFKCIASTSVFERNMSKMSCTELDIVKFLEKNVYTSSTNIENFEESNTARAKNSNR
jgi:hypothetical protein